MLFSVKTLFGIGRHNGLIPTIHHWYHRRKEGNVFHTSYIVGLTLTTLSSLKCWVLLADSYLQLNQFVAWLTIVSQDLLGQNKFAESIQSSIVNISRLF